MSKKTDKKIIETLKKSKPEVYANIKPRDRDFQELFFKAQAIRKGDK